MIPRSSSASPPVVSILVVDDNPSFRQGLQTLLTFGNQAGSLPCQVVGQAASVEQALQLWSQQAPQLILLDLELGQRDSLALLQRRQEHPTATRVLVISEHQEDIWVFRAMQSGACGYLLKQYLVERLWLAIRTVLAGQIYLSPEMTTSFFRRFHFYNGCSVVPVGSIALTEREREVLQWLVQGASNDAIARQMHITVATVKAHLTAIFEKLSVKSRTQAIVQALKLGLVTPHGDPSLLAASSFE